MFKDSLLIHFDDLLKGVDKGSRKKGNPNYHVEYTKTGSKKYVKNEQIDNVVEYKNIEDEVNLNDFKDDHFRSKANSLVKKINVLHKTSHFAKTLGLHDTYNSQTNKIIQYRKDLVDIWNKKNDVFKAINMSELPMASRQDIKESLPHIPENFINFIKLPKAFFDKIGSLEDLNFKEAKSTMITTFPGGDAVIQLNTSYGSARSSDGLHHELFHAYHVNEDIITVGGNIRDKDWQKIFNDAKTEFSKLLEKEDASIYTEENNLFRVLKKDNPDCSTRNVLEYCDTIGGLTNGKYGFGHEKSYYKSGKGANEVFAHMMSCFFFKNPMFDKYLPKTKQNILEYYGKQFNL